MIGPRKMSGGWWCKDKQMQRERCTRKEEVIQSGKCVGRTWEVVGSSIRATRANVARPTLWDA